MHNITPFVQWVGGKKHLKDILKDLTPKEFKNYYEPFIGGGGVFIRFRT